MKILQLMVRNFKPFSNLMLPEGDAELPDGLILIPLSSSFVDRHARSGNHDPRVQGLFGIDRGFLVVR